MFIPVAVGLLDSSGKDMPLTSVFHDGTLESLVNNGQPNYTTILRVTKVSSELLCSAGCKIFIPLSCHIWISLLPKSGTGMASNVFINP